MFQININIIDADPIKIKIYFSHSFPSPPNKVSVHQDAMLLLIININLLFPLEYFRIDLIQLFYQF